MHIPSTDLISSYATVRAKLEILRLSVQGLQ
jgi:hypothetical protein